MQHILALIEKIIEEHKTILERLAVLEQVANDAEAIIGLEKAKESFMPGRFDQKEGLVKLSSLLNLTDEGLQAHFNREETVMLAAFEEYGEREMASDFRSLLLEHEDIRSRLRLTKNDVSQLMSGGLSVQSWGALAHDMRAHISHTRKLLEAHAAIEQELLLKLRDFMKGQTPRGVRG